MAVRTRRQMSVSGTGHSCAQVSTLVRIILIYKAGIPCITYLTTKSYRKPGYSTGEFQIDKAIDDLWEADLTRNVICGASAGGSSEEPQLQCCLWRRFLTCAWTHQHHLCTIMPCTVSQQLCSSSVRTTDLSPGSLQKNLQHRTSACLVLQHGCCKQINQQLQAPAAICASKDLQQ